MPGTSTRLPSPAETGLAVHHEPRDRRLGEAGPPRRGPHAGVRGHPQRGDRDPPVEQGQAARGDRAVGGRRRATGARRDPHVHRRPRSPRRPGAGPKPPEERSVGPPDDAVTPPWAPPGRRAAYPWAWAEGADAGAPRATAAAVAMAARAARSGRRSLTRT